MNPIDKLLHNFVTKDLAKLEIDKHERASLIDYFLKKQKLTIRQFAEKYHIKKSTVSDWLLWGKITKEHYERLKKRGFNETKIRNMLRGDTKIPKEINIDFEIKQWIARIKHFINKPEHTEETINLIKELRNQTNRLWAKIEKCKENGWH